MIQGIVGVESIEDLDDIHVVTVHANEKFVSLSAHIHNHLSPRIPGHQAQGESIEKQDGFVVKIGIDAPPGTDEHINTVCFGPGEVLSLDLSIHPILSHFQQTQ